MARTPDAPGLGTRRVPSRFPRRAPDRLDQLGPDLLPVRISTAHVDRGEPVRDFCEAHGPDLGLYKLLQEWHVLAASDSVAQGLAARAFAAFARNAEPPGRAGPCPTRDRDRMV